VEPKSAAESGAPKEKSRFRLRKGFKFPRSWAEVRKLGWKFVVAFILFYLIRDSLLYILLPYLIYKGIISF
jgi:hypothetical protein